MDGDRDPFSPDRYESLTPPFLARCEALVQELDPLGLWKTTYPGLIARCLEIVDQLMGRVEGYMGEEPQALVAEALFVAFRAHGLTLRKSADALFFEHPLMTTDFLASFKLDAHTLSAALLHDVVEDTMLSVSQIVNQFGPDVGKLVDGVTRLRTAGKEVTSQLRQDEIRVESINKLFQFMVDDVRVVLIKLADRRHNMQTLDALPPEKQREKAHEVLAVYAPLAYRLGMWDVKCEQEALALDFLQPVLSRKLRILMARRNGQQRGRLRRACQTLRDHLSKVGLEVRIEPSPEQVYSVYHQHQRDGRWLPASTDPIRVAVLVNRRWECYRVLCAVHRLWKPVPGTFDDYIAHPRENLYQSLHTTVFGPGGWLKVRIRTHRMHRVAHHGILTRWSLDSPDQSAGLDEQIERLMDRLRPVVAIIDRKDRLAAYQEALTDQIQVFTPQVELIELPAGSTPLDFAYQVHTKVGDEARGVRINGVPRPLNTPLRNGDQVRILRSKGGSPLREWLDKDLGFVRTVYARNKIRGAFRRLERAEAISVGRETLHREMRMMGLEDHDLDAIARRLDHDSVEQMLAAIARADLMPHKVTHLALEPIWDALDASPAGGVILSPDGRVTVRGVPGRPVKLCATCQPVPGNPVVGNLLRGGQVTVHRMDCHHIVQTTRRGTRMNLVEVDWAEEPRTVRPVSVCVAAVDRSGLTHDLTRILETENVNICELYGHSDRERQLGLVVIKVEVTDLRQLSRILHRFSQLPNVKAARRFPEPLKNMDAVRRWAADSVHNS